MSAIVSRSSARRLARLGLAASLALVASLAPRSASAQGCVAARMTSPATGANVGGEAMSDSWEVFMSFRHFLSDKHFVGADHQENRDREHSQVKNDTNILQAGFRYTLGPRWSFEFSVPYIDIDRSSPLRQNGVVVDRATTHGEGIGDATFIARRWLLDHHKHPTGNLAIGLGAKFPTGENDQKDWRTRLNNAGVYTKNYEEVDQSIQPGDGGWGFIFELQGFKNTKGGHATFYGTLSYLFNPEETDHVLTNRSAPEEKYMSIADQYLARAGWLFRGKNWHGISAGVGLRLEGVPVRDLIGGSDWFRRPGYTLSVEPGFTWVSRHDSVAFSVPFTVDANRQKSIPDLKRGTHGDAAFADWSFEITYAHTFGGNLKADSKAAHDMEPAPEH